MNGSKAMIDELSGMLNEKCAGKETEVVVGVPSAYLMYTRDKVDKSVGVAAQNCYKAEKGAFTGTHVLCLISFEQVKCVLVNVKTIPFQRHTTADMGINLSWGLRFS